MQRFLNCNNEELYGRMEGLENQLTQNVGWPNGGNRRGNDGPRQNGIEGQNRIEGVKHNVPPFKGRSDQNTYLDWEMKIEHVFSCNDYMFIFPYGSFFSNSQQLYSREMKTRKAHRIIKYLKLKRMNPSIELRKLILDMVKFRNKALLKETLIIDALEQN